MNNSGNKPPEKKGRGFFSWLLILMAFGLMLMGLQRCSGSSASSRLPNLPVDALYKSIEDGKVKEVLITMPGGDVESVSGEDGKRYYTRVADGAALEKAAIAKGVKTTIRQDEKSDTGSGVVTGVIFFFLPTLIIAGVIVWSVLYQVKRMTNVQSQFGVDKKSVANWSQDSKVTFADVAGCDECKEEMTLAVEFLSNPDKFIGLGAKLPKGYLLIGSPGTGKTLLARALAGEAGVPFGYLNGADFVEMLVGVGPQRVRNLFQEAKQRAPCIVFIDEIEGMARKRGGWNGGVSEYDNTLSEFLGHMDGFEPTDGVIFIGATNQPEILDPALLRGGRFERHVVVPLPDVKGREEILKVHVRKVKAAKDVNLKEIAEMTQMLAGSELAKIVNEAAIIATLRGAESVEQKDLINGIDRALYGPERKNAVRVQSESLIAAYHEAGHTMASKFTEGADPVSKVTIIPRGQSGGATYMRPVEDIHFYTEKYLKTMLVVMSGGRAAEMAKFRQPSSGAQNDFQRGSEIALRMVAEWSMSPAVGTRVFQKSQKFLGGSAEELNCSEETKRLIDREVKELMRKAYDEAYAIIDKNNDKFEALALVLLKKETLSGQEVDDIFAAVDAKLSEKNVKTLGDSDLQEVVSQFITPA